MEHTINLNFSCVLGMKSPQLPGTLSSIRLHIDPDLLLNEYNFIENIDLTIRKEWRVLYFYRNKTGDWRAIVRKGNRNPNVLFILFKVWFQTLFYLIHNAWLFAIWLCFGLTNIVYDCQRYLVLRPWSKQKRKYNALT